MHYRFSPERPLDIYLSHALIAGSLPFSLGPHMLGPASLSGVPPAYISGTIMVPGHQHTHAGTLRRTLIPTSMGLMSSASPPPPVGLGIGPGSGMGLPPHSLASTGSGVYYDSTVPRNLARGMSTEGSGQYFYG